MQENHFIDESAMRLSGEPIEYTNVFIYPRANGLTVEEIEMDEFLAAREEQARKEKHRGSEDQRSSEEVAGVQAW